MCALGALGLQEERLQLMREKCRGQGVGRAPGNAAFPARLAPARSMGSQAHPAPALCIRSLPHPYSCINEPPHDFHGLGGCKVVLVDWFEALVAGLGRPHTAAPARRCPQGGRAALGASNGMAVRRAGGAGGAAAWRSPLAS